MRSSEKTTSVSFTSRVVGLVAVIVLAPLTVILGLAAGLFLVQQFLSGWLPSQWFSSSPLDWAYGMGVEGSASNYFGFMLTGVPAYCAFNGILWGLRRLRGQ